MICPICLEEKKELKQICKKHKYCETCIEICNLYLYNHHQCFVCIQDRCWVTALYNNKKK